MILNTIVTNNSISMGDKLPFNYYFALNGTNSKDNYTNLPYRVTEVKVNGKIVAIIDGRENKVLYTELYAVDRNISSILDAEVQKLEVLANKVKTTIDLNNIKGKPNETFYLKATLKDKNGNVIVNKEVNFYVNGVFVGSSTTNSNSIANLKYGVSS